MESMKNYDVKKSQCHLEFENIASERFLLEIPDLLKK